MNLKQASATVSGLAFSVLLMSASTHAQVDASATRFTASLAAELSLHDPVTENTISPEAGQPVRLRIKLTDPVTGRPPRGVELLGWVRVADDDNAACVKAAQNYRATQHTPLDSVNLNGMLLASLNRDATMNVIDPALNLYSSNMVAAHRLERQPASMAIDARHMRALFAYPKTGEIMSYRLTGSGHEQFAHDLPGVAALAIVSNGQVYAGGSEGKLYRLQPSGDIAESSDLGNGSVAVSSSTDPDLVIAFVESGRVQTIEGTTGRVLMDTEFDGPVADVSIVANGSAIALLNKLPLAELRYSDVPDVPIRIPLGTSFTRIKVDHEGRMALAYTPSDSLFVLIDLALGRVVQSMTLTEATISEVAFTDNAAFILSHDGGILGAIDIATVALGKEAVMRRIDLGTRTSRPAEHAELLVPLMPSPQILAVEPTHQTGWLVGELASSVEMPPMNSIRLRGGVPKTVKLVDRRLREVDSGVFDVVWAFGAGRHELILTTYSGQLSTCLPFEVTGDAKRLALTPVRLQLAATGDLPVAGKEHELAFRMVGPRGQPISIDRVSLLSPSMITSWSTIVDAVADNDGTLKARLTFPHAGTYVVHPLSLPIGYRIDAALVIDALPELPENLP